MRLSDNFSLQEFIISQTAERQGGEMLEQQNAPTEEVVSNLGYLAETCLQPLRTLMNTPMSITSGYRSPLLNTHIGSKPTSQHVVGEAADVTLSNAIRTSPSLGRYKRIVENQVYEKIGRPMRSQVNSNFYLFATAAIYMNELDIDQLIHEYGSDGEPGWIHMSSSRSKNRRQILKISKSGAESLTLEEALLLGA
ncbi:MAG: hypothetical protein K6L80_10925 [Agarilytica sp.]